MARPSFLIRKGKMTLGEKRALLNWYLTYEAGPGRPPHKLVHKMYPFTRADAAKLVRRGLMVRERKWIGGAGGQYITVIDMTPQGRAVARMILGLTRR